MKEYKFLKKMEDGSTCYKTLGEGLTDGLRSGINYVQNSRAVKAAEKVGRTIVGEVKLWTYDLPNTLIRENVGIPEETSTKNGVKHAVKNYFKPEINDKWDYVKLGFRYAGLATLVIATPILAYVDQQVSQNVHFDHNTGLNSWPGEGWSLFPIPTNGTNFPIGSGNNIPGELPPPPPVFPLSDVDNFFYTYRPGPRILAGVGTYGLFELAGNAISIGGRKIQKHFSKKND